MEDDQGGLPEVESDDEPMDGEEITDTEVL